MLWLAYAVFFVSGIPSVPFHPDESTQIFMSADVDTALHSFNELFWQAGKSDNLVQHYREVDAPLTRTLIGIERLVSGQPALASDWDWSKTWDQNQSAGALPASAQLLGARLPGSLLFLLGLIFLFDLARRAFDPVAALIACLILAFNPLILLHTRRAMAEGPLIFLTILSLWVMIRFKNLPILVGWVVGLAFCAKQSALALLIPAMVTVLSTPVFQKKWLSALRQGFLLVFSFMIVLILLNPFIWAHPAQAIAEAISQRQDLTSQQAQYIFSLNPEKNLSSIVDKSAAVLGALYFSSPAVADVSNYLDHTAPAAQAYFANPLNNILHDPFPSIIEFFLAWIGLILGILSVIHKRSSLFSAVLLIVSFFSLLLFFLFLISIPFQRYYLPLLPILSIWVGVSISFPVNSLLRK